MFFFHRNIAICCEWHLARSTNMFLDICYFE